MGCSVDTRFKKHHCHIQLKYPDMSAVVEHSINLWHHIQLLNTSILSTKPRYMDIIIREAIEIVFHPNNVNREDGFCLSKSWKSLICCLTDHRKSLSQDPIDGFSMRPCRSVHTALIRALMLPSPGAH
jgi:hypothetical protein